MGWGCDMKTMQFPCPVAYGVVAKGKKKSETQWVAHWVPLDFVYVNETEAPVVAQFDRDFPDGVFEKGFAPVEVQLPYERPRTQIRMYGGDLYVPLYHCHKQIVNCVEKLPELAPVRVGFDNFIQAFAEGNRKLVSNFRDSFRFGGEKNLEHVPKMLADELPNLATIEGTVESGSLQHTVDKLQPYTKDVIFINDDAWVKTAEPVIRVEMQPDSPVAHAHISHGRNDFGTYDLDAHVFRLDRLDDVRCHIAEHFPHLRLFEHFSDLNVRVPEVLTFEDERRPLEGVAFGLLQQRREQIKHMSIEEADAWYNLRDVLADVRTVTMKTGDEVAAALDYYVNACNKAQVDVPAWVAAASGRWKLRPIIEAHAKMTVGT